MLATWRCVWVSLVLHKKWYHVTRVVMYPRKARSLLIVRTFVGMKVTRKGTGGRMATRSKLSQECDGSEKQQRGNREGGGSHSGWRQRGGGDQLMVRCTSTLTII